MPVETIIDDILSYAYPGLLMPVKATVLLIVLVLLFIWSGRGLYKMLLKKCAEEGDDLVAMFFCILLALSIIGSAACIAGTIKYNYANKRLILASDKEATEAIARIRKELEWFKEHRGAKP